MIELVLLGVIAVLSALLVWEKRQDRLERSKLINALLARNATELANLEFVDKVKPSDTKVQQDAIATSDMTDEEFDEHIQEQLKAN